MNDEYAEIKAELVLTRRELMKRLSATTDYEFGKELIFDYVSTNKEKVILNHIKADLQDVERALAKMSKGTYGICEETGEKIPIEKLKILPTARTIHDFTFSELFEKKTTPRNNEIPIIENVYVSSR